MSGTVVVITNQAPADVVGSHGGTAVVQWKRLAVAGFSAGVLDSFDYNRVPPGAEIGLHTHHVTEEIYVVLSGRAEVYSGPTRIPVGPGDVAMIGRGGSHGVVNDSEQTLEFLVVEASPPSTLRALYARDAATPDPDRSSLVVRHVNDGGRLDLSALLNAAWGAVEMSVLAAGQAWTADAAEVERAAYVVAGSGRLTAEGSARDLSAGTALLFTRDSAGSVVAGPQGLRMVSIETGFDSVRTRALAADAHDPHHEHDTKKAVSA
jgi:mannose-6-phosphate isomerase-like protein (cupin superfamily)